MIPFLSDGRFSIGERDGSWNHRADVYRLGCSPLWVSGEVRVCLLAVLDVDRLVGSGGWWEPLHRQIRFFFGGADVGWICSGGSDLMRVLLSLAVT